MGQSDDVLAGFSGLEVWRGPVFEAKNTGVESEDEELGDLSKYDVQNCQT